MKRTKILILLAALLLTLTGCRTRTTGPVPPPPGESGQTTENNPGQTAQPEPPEDAPCFRDQRG